MQKNTLNVFFIVLIAVQSMMSFAIYLPSLPMLAHDLGLTHAQVQRTVTVYYLGMLLVAFWWGPIADYLGRKKTGLIVLCFSLCGHLILSFTTDYSLLLLGRMLQGAGSVGCIVVARSMMTDMYSGRALAKIGALLATALYIIPAVAPFIGGFLDHWFNWHASFKLLVVLCVIVMVLFALFAVDTLDASARSKKISWGQLAQGVGEIIKNTGYLRYSLINACVRSSNVLFILFFPFLLHTLYHFGPEKIGAFSLLVASGSVVGSGFNQMGLRYLTSIRTIIFIGNVIIFLAACSVLVNHAYFAAASFHFTLAVFFFCSLAVPMMASNASALAVGGITKNVGLANALMVLLITGFITCASFLISHFVPISLLNLALIYLLLMTIISITLVSTYPLKKKVHPTVIDTINAVEYD